jgi:hypothetical protein
MAAPDAAGFAAGDRALQTPGGDAAAAVHCLDGVRGRLTERSGVAEPKADHHASAAGRPAGAAATRASGRGHSAASTAHATDSSRAPDASAVATAAHAPGADPTGTLAHTTTAAAARNGHRRIAVAAPAAAVGHGGAATGAAAIATGATAFRYATTDRSRHP